MRDHTFKLAVGLGFITAGVLYLAGAAEAGMIAGASALAFGAATRSL